MENNYWREKLTKRDKSLYDKMMEAFYHYKERFFCANFSPNQLNEIYLAIINDHPELYYLPPRVEVRRLISILGTKEEIIIKNIFSRAQIDAYDNSLEKIKYEFSKKLQFCKNEFDKERLVAEFLIERTTYKINNLLNQNAATVLIDKIGQCSGIAKAVKLLLNWSGIKSIIVSGSAKDVNTGQMSPHAWNIVEIDGHCYHLDITFMLGANKRKVKPYSFYYFNYMDSEMKKTHQWNTKETPLCNYYYVNKDIKDSSALLQNLTVIVSTSYQLSKMIEDAVLRGDKIMNFESQIAVTQNELMAVVQNCCQKVIDKLAINLSMTINIKGSLVQIRW